MHAAHLHAQYMYTLQTQILRLCKSGHPWDVVPYRKTSNKASALSQLRGAHVTLRGDIRQLHASKAHDDACKLLLSQQLTLKALPTHAATFCHRCERKHIKQGSISQERASPLVRHSAS